MSRRGLGKEMRVPVKIQAIKNLFKGDAMYNITTAIDPQTNIHTMTIWWKN